MREAVGSALPVLLWDAQWRKAGVTTRISR